MAYYATNGLFESSITIEYTYYLLDVAYHYWTMLAWIFWLPEIAILGTKKLKCYTDHELISV